VQGEIKSRGPLVAQANGIVGSNCRVDYFRLSVRPAKARLEALIEDGRVERCRVEGCAELAYRDPEARLPRAIRTSAFLSPLDPVDWNRRRIRTLWNFDDRFEICTPAAKRRHGYSVLTFLMDDCLVGRLDLKVNRVSGRLDVLTAYHESHASPNAVAFAAAAELRSLARFFDVPSLRVGRRGNLARALRRELGASSSLE
jgi:uncharacterized protein YcaQ